MIEFKIYPNTYIDSVTLMSTTARLKKAFDVHELVMLMATDMNKEMIQSVGFEDASLATASPSDLVIGINHPKDAPLMDEIFQTLTESHAPKNENVETYKRIEELDESYNMAIISVAGQYAAYEAQKSLEKNMHVLMFSDNVSVEDEIRLKKTAIEKNLLMMGPDCGTAIINGVGLCFANAIQKGPVGLVAASGTGLQEVTVLIDQLGGGISQAIGVGGRDLSEAVGGLMMSESVEALKDDAHTEVIVVISKPPAPSVETKILQELKTVGKPVVVCFLDSDKTGHEDALHFVSTLSDAAFKAVELTGHTPEDINEITAPLNEQIVHLKQEFKPSQSTIKGLYCGGTLTAESLSLLRSALPGITSNVAKKPTEKMLDPMVSSGHNLVDLGDDVFTEGRPHPMIEPSIRLERIIEEAKNEETAVILLDFELGYGSHDDPIGITMETILEAQAIAKKAGRSLAFVAYVLGTDFDKQSKKAAEDTLKSAGVIVANTNAQAAKIASLLLGGQA